jgi:hypothetical protein
VADSGINLVVLEDRVGGAMDLFYKNLNPASNFTWSWTALASLIEDYSKSQCEGNATGNSSGSSQVI